MSLDVYLYIGDECVFDANINHNLGEMAREAGIYACLWRPDENGMTHARDIIDPLEKGLSLMVTNKRRFEEFDSPNGWGCGSTLCRGARSICRRAGIIRAQRL